MKPNRYRFFASVLIAFSITEFSNATTGTWSGTTTGTWDSTATNWTGVTGTPWDSTNGGTNDAVFNLASLAAMISGTVHTNGITFSTTGTLSGGTINFAGTTPSISVANSQTASIGSTISGSAGVTKTSAGTLILSGGNNYTGGTAINAGTVQIHSGGTLGSTSGALSMGTGSSGSIGTVGNLTVNTNTQVGTLSIISNTTNTSGANIAQLSIASGNTLTVSSIAMGLASSASGNTNTALATGVSNTGGTLTVSSDVTIGAQGSGNVGTQVMNLSGLTNFNAGSGASNFFRVGYGTLNASTVTLASTANVINVGTLSVGETVSNGNSGQNSALNLGLGTNALQANTIQIGTQKASGVLQFAHATNGAVVITGAGGTGTANIFVGNQSGSASYQSASLNNKLLLAGHTATVNAGTLNVARRTGTGGGNAVLADLTFDTGAFTTTGNVTLAQVTAVASTSNATGTFTLGTTSANTGALTVGTNGSPRNFILSDNRSTSTSATNGSFIINGGSATIHGNILDTSTTTTGTTTTTLTLNGGTLDMTNGNIGGDGTSGNRAITHLNFQSGTLQNVAQINNGAGLTKTTAGTLLLFGSNSYGGATLVNEGTLQISGGAAIPDSGLVTLADVTGANFHVLGSETIGALSGGGNTGGKLVLNGGQTLTLSSGTQIFAGVIEGAGGITINGATQTLSGNNSSYAGTVTLSSNAGPLNIGHQNALGTGSFVNQTANFTTLTNTSGAGISLSNSNYTINSSLIFGGSTTANNMNTGAGAFDLVGSDRILSVSNGVTVTIGGSISGDLRKDNTGTLILAGNGANLTRIRVTTGNLQLTGSTASTTSLTMGHQSGTQVGRFILGSTASAVNQTFGSLRTEGSAQTSQAVVGGNASISTLTINQTTNTTYAGILGGSGTNENQLALTKVGIGSLSLSGTNTYTGVTQVQGGTLEVAAGGSLATGSAVSVSNSGSELAVNGTVGGTLLVNTSTTLSGVGTIIGATTIHGTHNPGNSPGIQTFSNGLTYSNTAILNAEFVGNTLGIRGTDFDGINVTGGNLSIDSLATLNLLTSNVDYTLASWDVSRNFTIIDFSGAGSSSGQFTLNTSAAGLFASEGAWSLSNTNHDIFLSWTPIPEPHTTLLGSLGALMLLRRKR